jgi:ribonuclease P protein component
VQCRPDACGDVRRVAFAVSRQVGSAVVRNRVRRRLRAALQELDRLDDPRFPPGDYLVRVRPGAGALGFDVLRDDLHRSLARLGVSR